MSSQVGRRHYGKVPVVVRGAQGWNDHDATQTWSDEGEVRAIVEGTLADLTKRLEAVVAKNASYGVSEYLAYGEGTMSLSEQGELLIGVRVANEQAALIVYVPFRALIVNALSEIRPHLGVDPQAQNVLSQLIHLGTQLANLGRPADSVRTKQPSNGSTHDRQKTRADT